MHVKNILECGELDESSTVAFFATVQNEGERNVERQIAFYNLDMIISVGYRVNSYRGVQFRMWATNVLKEYLIKGFAMNDELLKRAGINVNVVSDEQAEEVFNENNGEQTEFSIQSINDKFNKELLSINEKNADSKYLSLGMPNDILQSTGIQNKELKLYGNKIIKKAKKHGFQISDLTNLPKSISKPIAIFSGAIENSHAVLTELKIDNKNVLVSISIGKNNDIDFNIVSSVYGKDAKGVLDWINKEKMLYTNKNKTLDYLRISAPIADAQNNQEFDVAAKVIQNFENPPINDEKTSTNAEKLSTSGGLIYGYAQNGEIYLTERGLNPNTPVHEYTHLWAAAMMKKQICNF